MTPRIPQVNTANTYLVVCHGSHFVYNALPTRKPFVFPVLPLSFYNNLFVSLFYSHTCLTLTYATLFLTCYTTIGVWLMTKKLNIIVFCTCGPFFCIFFFLHFEYCCLLLFSLAKLKHELYCTKNSLDPLTRARMRGQRSLEWFCSPDSVSWRGPRLRPT